VTPPCAVRPGAFSLQVLVASAVGVPEFQQVSPRDDPEAGSPQADCLGPAGSDACWVPHSPDGRCELAVVAVDSLPVDSARAGLPRAECLGPAESDGCWAPRWPDCRCGPAAVAADSLLDDSARAGLLRADCLGPAGSDACWAPR
jgi:hypothetical protein